MLCFKNKQSIVQSIRTLLFKFFYCSLCRTPGHHHQGERPTFGINGSFGSPENKFSINFSKANAKFCLSLHYNSDNSYLFVNGQEICKFKTDNKNVNFPTQFCLEFSESLARKCVPINDEPCIVRPTLIDLNPIELKYYPFMISLDKCTESCNVLSPKTCVPKETKDINVKVFNIITNKNEVKILTKHIPCDCKCKFNSTTCNSNQNWNSKACQCECRHYIWNPSTCICENIKYLKSIADTSVIACAEIIFVMDIISTKMANTIAANVAIFNVANVANVTNADEMFL